MSNAVGEGKKIMKILPTDICGSFALSFNKHLVIDLFTHPFSLLMQNTRHLLKPGMRIDTLLICDPTLFVP